MRKLNLKSLACALTLAGMALIGTGAAHAASRGWSYTYHANGLLATADGPRTDVSDVTGYTYDSGGNLSQVTNALNQITVLSSHDAYGNPQTITDPNGVASALVYTSQGWLASVTVSGRTTSFQHDAIGQITRITRGDGSWLQYTWDNARRLTAVENNLGERTEYDLNNMGQRTAQRLKDGTSTLKRQQQWVYDELGRLLQSIGAGSQTRTYAYDLNNNQVSDTNPRTFTHTQAFDALDRLVSSTDPLSGITTFVHDAQDNLTQVVDPRGVTTTYQYDGLGNLTQRISPDSGTTTYAHDAVGNITQSTDARGVVTNYAYDALNRLTAREYPATPALDVAYGHDATASGNYGIGRLTSVQDASGTLSYHYDARGNLTAQTRTVDVAGGSRSEALAYAYDNADNLIQIGYPADFSVQYTRNSGGQVSAVGLTVGANPPTALASSISYLPFGPVKGLTWGNGLALSRSYDQDYRMTQQTVGSWLSGYTYDANSNITQLNSSLWGELNYTYDALDRLTKDARSNLEDEYTYDEVGNRTSKEATPIVGGVPGSSTTTNYSYGSTNNRLTAIGLQTVLSDAAGNLTQDRANRQLTHDAQGRLASVSIGGAVVAEFVYNALGQRTHKITTVGTSTYLYSPNGQLLGETQHDFAGAKLKSQYFVWLDALPVAVVDVAYDSLGAITGTTALYLHADHLNTPRLATKPNQAVAWRLPASDAFGTAAAEMDPDADSVQTVINLRFPGQVFDVETGLNYNYFRDYDPETGRYVQSDPIGLAGGVNTFAYVKANPLTYVDPEGLVTGVGVRVAQGLGIACMMIPGCMEQARKAAQQCIKAARDFRDWMTSEAADTPKGQTDTAVDGLTDGLDSEIDSKGRPTKGHHVKPGGDAQQDLNALPGTTGENGQKTLPDGSVAGIHTSTTTGVDTLHIHRPSGSRDIKIRYPK